MADDNKARSEQFLTQVIRAQDVSKFDEFIAADAAAHHVPPGMPPTAESWRSMMAGVFAAFPGWKFNVGQLVAEGDRVALRWTAEATNSGDFMGIPATGKTVSMNGMIIERWADGKAAEHWEQIDMMGLMQQLGLAG